MNGELKGKHPDSGVGISGIDLIAWDFAVPLVRREIIAGVRVPSDSCDDRERIADLRSNGPAADWMVARVFHYLGQHARIYQCISCREPVAIVPGSIESDRDSGAMPVSVECGAAAGRDVCAVGASDLPADRGRDGF